ncbi:ABC transporter permease, partial [Klebsiella pneumoniae]|nr:ABC transporter permease [Klebsiella pneumoniae]
MISLIYSEFLKLKRSSIIFYMAIGSSFMPLLLDAAVLISNDRQRTYESYMYNSEGISFTFM